MFCSYQNVAVAKFGSLFSAIAISFKAPNVAGVELTKLDTYVCVAYVDRSIDRVLDIECNDKGRCVLTFVWRLLLVFFKKKTW